MKLFLIGCLLLCACATGVSDPIEDPVIVVVDSPKPQLPKPPKVEEEDSGEPPRCHIDAYWVGNCYVVDTYCVGQQPHTAVSCGPGRPLWPWEIIPDPPYDNRK